MNLLKLLIFKFEFCMKTSYNLGYFAWMCFCIKSKLLFSSFLLPKQFQCESHHKIYTQIHQHSVWNAQIRQKDDAGVRACVCVRIKMKRKNEKHHNLTACNFRIGARNMFSNRSKKSIIANTNFYFILFYIDARHHFNATSGKVIHTICADSDSVFRMYTSVLLLLMFLLFLFPNRKKDNLNSVGAIVWF